MAAALALAAWLRLPGLAQRPMHGDEAIHAIRCEDLWETGRFEYDPADYHGPTLYYCTLPIRGLYSAASFAQTSESLYRLVPAVFGLLMIPLLGLLRCGLGRAGITAAALLLAVSPAMVFYSRYYIQEMLLACFTLAAIGCGWRFAATRGAGWAAACGAAVGLMHATKETCVLSFAAAAGALAVVAILRQARQRSLALRSDAPPVMPPAARRGRCFGALVGVAAAVLVSIACYSVFFTYGRGPLDSLLALGRYLERSGGAGLHEHPWHWYLARLAYTHYRDAPAFSEALILLLGALGLCAAFTRGADAMPPPSESPCAGAAQNERALAGDFRGFLAIYALALTLAYSAIPYKTPWCAVQFLLPTILLAGLAVDRAAARVRPLGLRLLLGALLAGGVADLAAQSEAATSPRMAADHRNPYVYAHPVRGVVRLGRYVQRLAEASAAGAATRVNVIMDDAWPLPWYLRGLSAVGYWETIPSAERGLSAHGGIAAPVVIATTQNEPALDARLGAAYHKSYYGLRPDVVCVVYVEESLRREFVRRQAPPANGEDAP